MLTWRINVFGRARELCESRGGCPGLHVPVSHRYGLYGRETTLNSNCRGIQSPGAVCESRGGRPGLPVHYRPYGLRGRKVTLNFSTSQLRTQELCESEGVRGV